jgi:hypothetical protein
MESDFGKVEGGREEEKAFTPCGPSFPAQASGGGRNWEHKGFFRKAGIQHLVGVWANRV